MLSALARRRFSVFTPEKVLEFSKLTQQDTNQFERILGPKGVVTAEEELEAHNIDWTKKFVGHSKLMLKPASTEETAEVLKYCNSRSLAVVPQGGNTGLVGGNIPVFDEIIINTARMNKILAFDDSYGILSAQAGCILSDLQDFTKEKNYEVPLDLGAKGSCMIGGNLATNAGGIKYIKHNSMHANCVGLKAVLPDGRILDNMTTLRKDNTGYDLKHLFIGSEGTLGIITECALLCPPMLNNRNLAMVTCNTWSDVLKLLREAKTQLGDILQAFEVMDAPAVTDVFEQFGDHAVDPFQQRHPFYVLIEVASKTIGEDDESPNLDRLFNLIEEAGETITDGVVAQDQKQFD